MAVREICKDTNFLQQKSKKAEPNSNNTKSVIEDLIDTANKHKDRCVGLSAIQIGVPLRICVVFNGDAFIPFVNPVITKFTGDKYVSEEGCMSLDGTREVVRYEKIEIIRQNSNERFVKEKFKGFMAEILQHEIDHFNGKLI